MATAATALCVVAIVYYVYYSHDAAICLDPNGVVVSEEGNDDWWQYQIQWSCRLELSNRGKIGDACDGEVYVL